MSLKKENFSTFIQKSASFFSKLLGLGAIGKEPASILQLSWRNSTLSRDCRGEGREESEFSLLCHKAEESVERWHSYSETKNPVLCLSTALRGLGEDAGHSQRAAFSHGRELLRLLQLPLLDLTGKSF